MLHHNQSRNQVWSVNRLAAETGIDRRTLRKYLAEVRPAEEGTHGPLYRLRDVIAALREVELIPPLADPMDRALWDIGGLLDRALRRGLAQRLADAGTPAEASRAVREFYADIYYRAMQKLEGGPRISAQEWSEADGPRFERAYRVIRTRGWGTEEVAAALRELADAADDAARRR